MIRPSALLMLCLTLLLPMAAVARLDGPLEVAKPGKVRDLADIRSSRTSVSYTHLTLPTILLV